MMGLTLSRRARFGLIAVLVAALILCFPLRLAFGLFDLDRYGVSARGVHGAIWRGAVDRLTIGDVPAGTVDASLSPLQLLVGRARLDIWRKHDLPDDIEGAISAGIGGRIGLEDATGSLPLGSKMAPLPISGLDLEDVSARFVGGTCAHAEGRVRAHVAGQVAGLNLSQGLSGEARCDGGDILVPLISQSGMEKLNLRITPGGRYRIELRVTTTDPALAAALGASGFRQSGNDHALRIEGTM